MAISQMEKVSLVFPKESLDAVLLALQASQIVQVREISQLTDWQDAFAQNQVQLPQIHLESKKGLLSGDEALSYLSRRQQSLEMTIEKLNRYLPKEGLLKSLRRPDFTLSFNELENFGQGHVAEKLLETINAKIDRVQLLERQLAESQTEIDRLSNWRDLEVSPKELERFEFIKAIVGSVPKTADDGFYHKLKDDPYITCQDVFNSELEYGVIIFYEAKQDIPLQDYGFVAFDYDEPILPATKITQLKEKSQKLEREKASLIAELQDSGQALQDLQVQTDYVLGLYSRQKVKYNLASTKHLIALEGWVQAEEVADLKAEIAQQFGDSVFVQEFEVEEDDWDQVPIKLKNHPLIEPFELVTEMYALPKYYEKDPTPILAPFYFTIFGMMVADLGYGLFMVIATALALKCFNLSKGTRRFIKFFNILGVAVSLWGIVYGSFFGFTLPLVLISTTTDVMTILMLSVAFGFVTVIVGLLLGGIQRLRMKDYGEAYNSGFAWCLILIGILLIALGTMMPGMGVLRTIGAVLAIANAVGIVAVSIFQAKSLVGLGTGLYNLYNISGYVGDLVSFTRLMALGLSGASIGSAFNLIVNIFPPVARFSIGIVIFILLHAINIFLSLLSGYVHGARLMFVEFFGKFYEGGGKAFQPLKSAEKYVKIRKTHLEE